MLDRIMYWLLIWLPGLLWWKRADLLDYIIAKSQATDCLHCKQRFILDACMVEETLRPYHNGWYFNRRLGVDRWLTHDLPAPVDVVDQ